MSVVPWNYVFVYFENFNISSELKPTEKVGEWYFQIQNHRLTMIATDGSPIKPVVVDCFYSTTGERYDFVLNPTTNKSITEVFMRVRGFGVCADTQVQELARIMIVDDLEKVEESNGDYLPVLEYPAYDAPYTNDIVRRLPAICRFTEFSIFHDLIFAYIADTK